MGNQVLELRRIFSHCQTLELRSELRNLDLGQPTKDR